MCIHAKLNVFKIGSYNMYDVNTPTKCNRILQKQEEEEEKYL